MNKKNILIGVCFLFATLFCLLELFNNGVKSYYITGVVLFTFVGIAYIKKANDRG